jgi:FkbM family methyltransferase
MGMPSTPLNEAHPPQMGYRLARRLRGLQHFRGWRRLAAIFAPPNQIAPFRVWNNGIVFEGNISSFLDREIYLFGQYEQENIDLFLGMVPRDRRGIILDIGANIGTHALTFSRHFEKVHSFEPNAALWPQFERNVALNNTENIVLHKVGLGVDSGNRPFFSIDGNNFGGSGTFSTVEQYDLPLKQVGVFRLENGDEYIANLGVENLDAIKIDVQGLEPDVLSGLTGALRKFRPIVWFEYGLGTRDKMRGASDIKSFFPYPIAIWRMAQQLSLTSWCRLEPVGDEEESPPGEFVVVPAERGGVASARAR